MQTVLISVLTMVGWAEFSLVPEDAAELHVCPLEKPLPMKSRTPEALSVCQIQLLSGPLN